MIQNIPYMHQQTPLPPGKYVYSNNFPAVMEQIAPIYTIPTKPVFFDHLMMHLDKTIRVITLNGPLEGTLTGVAIDHLQLTIGDYNYHVHYPNITYFVTPK
ncbi:DUF2642 domain-containing protein [Aquibacillus rhizosphaerae]|uniref:DUF2642 domain-containing protein n=1 Tax=Aquibacillus rhizosphaerae TaxID=3051431 RepID=A0ABT7L931_9BACI|nr:DUF2642 domain-containing protein [Aquibacillus sp. LR5S19]MDL4842373.1 DUF2642 domain-containing protein [Aquibacillus sp. LR5S19]